MQYLLTEEEMQAIRDERASLERIPCGRRDLHLALENVCKMVATTMIPTARTAFQTEALASGNPPAPKQPYGCIHVDRMNSYEYCDRCPVQGICPMPKEYSK